MKIAHYRHITKLCNNNGLFKLGRISLPRTLGFHLGLSNFHCRRFAAKISTYPRISAARIHKEKACSAFPGKAVKSRIPKRGVRNIQIITLLTRSRCSKTPHRKQASPELRLIYSISTQSQAWVGSPPSTNCRPLSITTSNRRKNTWPTCRTVPQLRQ